MNFEYYYETYFAPLSFYAKGIIHNPEVAKDMVQDVFIKTWKLGVDLSCEPQVKAYLYKGVKRSCLNFLARKQFDSIDGAAYLEADTTNFVKMDYYARLFEIVRYLPPECRRVIVLYYQEGYNSGEISKILGLAPSTVKNHMIRGVRLLREMIEKGRQAPRVINALNSIAYTLRRVKGYRAGDVSEITGIHISQLATRIAQFEKAVTDFRGAKDSYHQVL